MTANNYVHNENDDNEKVLPAAKTSPKYQESSIRFRDAWQDFMRKEQVVKYEIAYMIRTLENDLGYKTMEAIKKVVNDHNDLPGFSQKTIYRQLPDEMKNKELGRPNLSSDKLGQTNNNSNNDNAVAVVDYSYQEEDEQEGDNQKTRTLPTAYDVKEAETTEQEEPSSLVVDLRPSEPEIQDPKITTFVGQLPKPVLKLAEKIELSPTKLQLIVEYSNKSILKDHPKIQKNLVEGIAPLTIEQAKIEISQAIRDLETGATVRIDDSYYFDYTKREKIPKKTDRVKHPALYFLDLMDKIDEVLYVGTGYKITRDDDVSSYEPNHIAATQKHRFAILNAIEGNQINMLEDKIEVLRDLLGAFDHEIDEVWKNKK